MSVDLRKSIGKMIEEKGNETLYIRNSKYIRCKCFSETTNEGRPDCKICFGSGKLTSTEKLKVLISGNTSSTAGLKHTKIGLTDNSTADIYMDNTALPQMDDVVCLVGWNGDRPSNIIRVFKISNVVELRCDNGRIEAYYCSATNASEYEVPLNKYIKTLSPRAIQTLNKGGKWKWSM